MNKTQENAQTGKYTADKLDMRATSGCSYHQCKKEAFITIIAYLVFAVFTIASCGIF